MDSLQTANLRRGYLVGPRSEDEMVRASRDYQCTVVMFVNTVAVSPFMNTQIHDRVGMPRRAVYRAMVSTGILRAACFRCCGALS